jgi:hypothetical protein
MTRCPKCSGFLLEEHIREHGGFFHGFRCIQCGLRLDELIVKNRVENPVPAGDFSAENRETEGSPSRGRRTGRLRRTPART